MPGFTLFVFLWCAGILFHQLYQGRFLVLDPTCLLSLAAVYSLLRPASLPRFAALLVLHVAVVGLELPRVSNHWLLSGITSFGLLLTLGPTLARGRQPSGEALARALRSVGAQIIVLYVLVTLAKINAGFFDPAASCGALHYRRLAASLPLLPTAPWAIWAAILGTLLIEGTLPLLLLLRPTRLMGCAAGWLFHLVLGFNGYWDFSMMAAAYYVAFVPARVLEGGRLAAQSSSRIARFRAATARISGSRVSGPLALLALLIPAGMAAFSGAADRDLVLAANRAGRWIWLAAWLGLGAAGAAAIRASLGQPDEPRALGAGWWRQPVLLVAPLLALTNGLSPYLGLKTENSYTMFSNLRTEGGEWNHYLVPKQLQVFGFQDELVRILRSNDAYFAKLAAGGYRLVPFEFQRHTAKHPDAVLAYESGGRRATLRRAAQDPKLAEPPHPVLAKLLLFRPVPPPERNECLH